MRHSGRRAGGNSCGKFHQKTKVPIYLLSGWYDHHHGSSMKTWERLNEETKQHSWLEIGAWNHFFQICLEDKEVLHPQNEEIPKMLEWFELTLNKRNPNTADPCL